MVAKFTDANTFPKATDNLFMSYKINIDSESRVFLLHHSYTRSVKTDPLQ